MEKEKLDVLLTELICIMDDFELFRKSVKKDQHKMTKEVFNTNANYLKIYRKLGISLKKIGISKINSIPGDDFDPKIHDAKFVNYDPKYKDDQITQIISDGYLLNNKVIRTCSVSVNKKG